MLPVKRSRRKDLELPPPATAAGANGATAGPSSPNSNSNTNKKTATFTDEAIGTGVRVHWSRFKKRLGAGSNISESLLEITESNGTSDKKDDQSLPATSNEKDSPNPDDEEVNEIVVDNKFSFEGGPRSITQPSDHGGTPEKSGTSATHGTYATDHDSVHSHRGMMAFFSFLSALRFRIASSLNRFFFTEFFDAAAERQYKKETYYQMKGLSLAGSLVLVLNWVLICILIPRESLIFADKMFYWVLSPCFVVPLPVMIVFDWPKKYPRTYQLFMTLVVWSWCAYVLLLLQLCGFYNKAEMVMDCKSKEFVGVFFYTGAYPAIALFALGQNRLMGAVMAMLNAVLIASVIRVKKTWIRNFLNYLLYTVFLLWIHYTREAAERRLYTMRDRLKVQYRATQKAQVRESRAADSKKRFSSYIFHEVRVPLNTALLAVQNMQATGLFAPDDIEYTALEGSLNMMSKVLNDVLDFNRMDSGRFESVSKPYAFHKVIKGMLVPLRMTAAARGQELITELDSQIDVMARTALYRAKGMSEDKITKLLQDGDDEDGGLIVGDEHRLRQVVTNLASNACKFTPGGGTITVRTKLLLPGFGSGDDGTTAVGDSSSTPVKPRTDDDDDDCPPLGNDDDFEDGDPRVSHDIEAPPLTGARLAALESSVHPRQDQIIIRIEVEDTGVGIRRRDMVDNKLFSPYVQTDLGRFQGGKGTGLGLALSKHIVRLSGGRLGVKSKRGHGSMFWVELAVGVGQKVIANSDFQHMKDGIVAQSFAFNRDTTEAFKLPEGEGVTPSTLQSSTSESVSPREEALCAQQVQQTQQAMGRLMEHSGQIELLSRAMPHRKTDGSAMSSSTQLRFGGSKIDLNVPSQQPATGGTTDGGPPSPTMSKRSSKGVLGASAGLAMTSVATEPETVKAVAVPTRPSMPDPESFDSASTAGPSKNDDPSSETLKPPAGSSAAKPPPPSPFSPPLNVLVVDDDGLTRKLMARMLTRNGCVVETADNGKSAFDMAINAKNPFTWDSASPSTKSDGGMVHTPYLQELEPKYDVIFLDNQMPVMSGVDTVRRLRAMKRKDFVVGVTGNALKEDQEEYLEAGVDAVLTKPVAEADLKKCLFSADERRKQAAAERQRRTSDAPSVSVAELSPPGPS